MEKVIHIIGADLSKKSIDLADARTNTYIRIENSMEGFKKMLKWFTQQKMKRPEIMLVMEHTGFYGFCLERFLHQRGIAFCKIHALEIKRSMGMVRGKSDKVDAYRIALYGSQKINKLKPESPTEESIQRLKMLQTSRQILVKQRASLLCAVKEYRNIGISDKDITLKAQLDVIKAITKQIEKLESEMQKVLQADDKLLQNFELLISIKGVGKITALMVLIKTHNFTRFTKARKFACYCGIAPFEHTSGTSIKGKSRVSHFADKEMKCILDLSAKAAIAWNPEMKSYYWKRLGQGKSKMGTINIIRNKLLYRMFSVIKRQAPYQESYLRAA